MVQIFIYFSIKLKYLEKKKNDYWPKAMPKKIFELECHVTIAAISGEMIKRLYYYFFENNNNIILLESLIQDE